MRRITFVYTRTGLQNYEQLMLHLSKRARRLLQVFARFAKTETTRRMQKSMFDGLDANNPPWAQAKGGSSSRVLYWTGWLASQVSYETEIPPTGDIIADVNIGWSRSKHPEGNITARDLVEILVSGRTWTPSPAQRRAFHRRVPPGAEWSEYQDVYIQPGRPFLDQITQDPKIYGQMHITMDKALALVLGDKKKVRRI